MAAYYYQYLQIIISIGLVTLGYKKSCTYRPVSPSSFYLLGDLAQMELNLIEQFSNHLEQCDFIPFSCPDLVKTLVVVSTIFCLKDSYS